MDRLNGFEAIFDINTNLGDKQDDKFIDLDAVAEELTDEELAALQGAEDKEEEEEEEIEPVKPEPAKKEKPKKEEIKKELEEEEEEEDQLEEEEEDGETKMVTGFFEALSEKLGWDIEEGEEVPTNAEELIEYFQNVIEENSTPTYANDEVAKLDEFVKNGGNIRDYLTIDVELDLENVDLEDENTQKAIVKELFKEKGYSAKQIEKKLTKYEEAGILEDEAEDAVEALTEIRAKKKEQLLVDQQKKAEAAKKQQQDFFNSVVTEIKGMKDIRGIAIPEKDKSVLLDYMFKLDANGVSKYKKDYAKSIKNYIESAYFTMKGDVLLNVAKSEGKKDAINKFKDSLKNNRGVDKKSKKEIKTSDDSLWSSFTRQLRVA